MASPTATDALLEKYLHLVDQYTTSRRTLSDLQALMFRDLARANFHHDRGMRFGPDQYDSRAQASRGVQVESWTTWSTGRGDALRWFGVLTPSALASARDHAVRVVDEVARLGSVDAEMRALEIEVRRARKRAAKGGV